MSKILWMCVLCTISVHTADLMVVKRSACKADEMFVECAHCGPKYCEELGQPKPCTGSTGLCRPECVCMDGFVRNENGACILKNECPHCGGDRNATSGCGDHCGRSCSDYKDTNKTCFSSCQYNRCDCRKGYVFHDKLGVCVLPVDCEENIVHDVPQNDAVIVSQNDSVIVPQNDSVILSQNDSVIVPQNDYIIVSKNDSVIVSQNDSVIMPQNDSVIVSPNVSVIVSPNESVVYQKVMRLFY